MNTRLNHIRNWPELAREANWSAAALAKMCGVSVRTLHRFFLMKEGKNTKIWMAKQRQRHAIELLGVGSSVKETAFLLGYKQSANFARNFKKHFGVCPSQQPSAVYPARPANVRN